MPSLAAAEAVDATPADTDHEATAISAKKSRGKRAKLTGTEAADESGDKDTDSDGARPTETKPPEACNDQSLGTSRSGSE